MDLYLRFGVRLVSTLSYVYCTEVEGGGHELPADGFALPSPTYPVVFLFTVISLVIVTRAVSATRQYLAEDLRRAVVSILLPPAISQIICGAKVQIKAQPILGFIAHFLTARRFAHLGEAHLEVGDRLLAMQV